MHRTIPFKLFGLACTVLILCLANAYAGLSEEVRNAAQRRLEARIKQQQKQAIMKVGAIKINPTDGAEMVFVPGTRDVKGSGMRNGAFLMGKSHGYDTQPIHEVELDAFWIYRHEVSNWQFVLFVEKTGKFKSVVSSLKVEGLDYPVKVTYKEAKAYCKWTRTRLITEAEWEWAAKGPNAARYPWGDDWRSDALNSDKLSPVGAFPSGASWCNALDMAGNLSEWCNDYFGKYEARRLKNPQGPMVSLESSNRVGLVTHTLKNIRVVRGGSWGDKKDEATFCTTARRFDGDQDARTLFMPAAGYPKYSRNGFRCVVDFP